MELDGESLQCQFNPSAVLPTWGLEGIDQNFTIGFVHRVHPCDRGLARFSRKRTLGFEIKACGLNKDAAKYAGINEKEKHYSGLHDFRGFSWNRRRFIYSDASGCQFGFGC
jgi:hypothetical protein